MAIGKQNPKLQWAKSNEEECKVTDGDPANHNCCLKKGHMPLKKHACSCGHEFYVRNWNPPQEIKA